MSAHFTHEHLIKTPRGYRVRTLVRGKHRLRFAVPKGPRRKGAAKLIEILHPRSENPKLPCKVKRRPNPLELVVLGNPKRKGREGDPFTYHQKKVKAMLAKMPKPILDVFFDRNPGLSREEQTSIIRGQNLSRSELLRLLRRMGISAQRVKSNDELIRLIVRATDSLHGRNPRRNPAGEEGKAAALYQEFHGREAAGKTAIDEPAGRSVFAGLGELLELTIETPNGTGKISFSGDGVQLAANPEGTQLYAKGGNQDISPMLKRLGVDAEKDLIELGRASTIVYRGRKSQTNFSKADYEHEFGEEGGQRPKILFDRVRRQIEFAGGSYKIEAPGIIN
jgi:hypothetical protein